jgi:hypothetical protein
MNLNNLFYNIIDFLISKYCGIFGIGSIWGLNAAVGANISYMKTIAGDPIVLTANNDVLYYKNYDSMQGLIDSLQYITQEALQPIQQNFDTSLTAQKLLLMLSCIATVMIIIGNLNKFYKWACFQKKTIRDNRLKKACEMIKGGDWDSDTEL